MAACASCRNPLVLPAEPADQAGDLIPDDLQLSCGCHFHWQCLLDEATQVANSLKCPSCRTNLVANQASSSSSSPSTGIHILTRYVNEGGLQENYDIYPDILEESYLLAHPEAGAARAFLTMCSEGDVMGIVSMMSGDGEDGEDEDNEMEDDDEDDQPSLSAEEILRYQDTLNNLQSGLHLAIQNDQQEVFYLLLFLASRLPLDSFPPEVLQSAGQIGLTRPASIATHADIRTLQNQQGETAEAIARRLGGQWAFLTETGIFTRL